MGAQHLIIASVSLQNKHVLNRLSMFFRKCHVDNGHSDSGTYILYIRVCTVQCACIFILLIVHSGPPNYEHIGDNVLIFLAKKYDYKSLYRGHQKLHTMSDNKVVVDIKKSYT